MIKANIDPPATIGRLVVGLSGRHLQGEKREALRMVPRHADSGRLAGQL